LYPTVPINICNAVEWCIKEKGMELDKPWPMGSFEVPKARGVPNQFLKYGRRNTEKRNSLKKTEDEIRKNGIALKRRNTEYGKTEGQNHGKTRKHGTEYGNEKNFFLYDYKKRRSKFYCIK
jgi:hypothetical protein